MGAFCRSYRCQSAPAPKDVWDVETLIKKAGLDFGMTPAERTEYLAANRKIQDRLDAKTEMYRRMTGDTASYESKVKGRQVLEQDFNISQSAQVRRILEELGLKWEKHGTKFKFEWSQQTIDERHWLMHESICDWVRRLDDVCRPVRSLIAAPYGMACKKGSRAALLSDLTPMMDFPVIMDRILKNGTQLRYIIKKENKKGRKINK